MTLWRRALAEAMGTGLLVTCVIGSGIAASRLSPDDVGLQLLENSLATGAVLVALILALHPVSAAFNPLVSLLEAGTGSIRWGEAGPLVAAQVTGGVVGAVLANLMFGLSAVSISQHTRASMGTMLGEVVASFGLVLVVFGGLRQGRIEALAVAVGAYIAAAYWFTSSTSFANPAVTAARVLSDTFAGIAPGSAPWFVLSQVVGAGLGGLAVAALFSAPQVQETLDA